MQKPIEIIDNENVDFFVKFVLFLYKAKSFDSSFAGGKEDRVLCYSKITSRRILIKLILVEYLIFILKNGIFVLLVFICFILVYLRRIKIVIRFSEASVRRSSTPYHAAGSSFGL